VAGQVHPSTRVRVRARVRARGRARVGVGAAASGWRVEEAWPGRCTPKLGLGLGLG